MVWTSLSHRLVKLRYLRPHMRQHFFFLKEGWQRNGVGARPRRRTRARATLQKFIANRSERHSVVTAGSAGLDHFRGVAHQPEAEPASHLPNLFKYQCSDSMQRALPLEDAALRCACG